MVRWVRYGNSLTNGQREEPRPDCSNLIEAEAKPSEKTSIDIFALATDGVAERRRQSENGPSASEWFCEVLTT